MLSSYYLNTYNYSLPKSQIAQFPVEPREKAKLMLIERKTGSITHHCVDDLQTILTSDDLLIFNNTKVLPARLYGKGSGGGKVECLLLRKIIGNQWEVLIRPSKKYPVGKEICFGEQLSAQVCEELGEGKKIVSFKTKLKSFEELLENYGQMPLPPYIHRENKDPKDNINYQTLFAEKPGAVAAPTASLHFTTELLHKFEKQNIEWTTLTLHVGLGTFKPIQTEDIREHPMHYESYELSQETATLLNQTKNKKRHVSIGTTVCRVLESLTHPYIASKNQTNIFIYPEYRFRSIDALFTNFHLPASTLIMLVSAFAGYELCMEAYAKAIENNYRFYSYGDAMFIV
jgi:S-adenosylmethionine:tRNA ribosyltransferase-isomerase